MFVTFPDVTFRTGRFRADEDRRTMSAHMLVTALAFGESAHVTGVWFVLSGFVAVVSVHSSPPKANFNRSIAI